MDSDSSFLEGLVEAQGHYMMGFYSLALEKFNQLSSSSNNHQFNLLIYRGLTHWKLNHLSELFRDAEMAESIDSHRYEVHYLKAIGLFAQARFDEALKCIQRAKLILSSSNVSDQRGVEVTVLEKKIEAEKSRYEKVNKPKTEIKQPVSDSKVAYQWRQTDNRIYIDIKFGLKKKEDFKLKLEDSKVDIFFPITENRNFELNLDLYDEIIPEESQHSILLDKIEIQLAKKTKGNEWRVLEKTSSENEKVLETTGPKPVVATENKVPAYPTSSKVKKDWDKIDKEIDEDIKKNSDEYLEGDKLNKLFKEIYANADENTRKAMMKSFQTSGGTVLSTNWGEVSEKDYEGKDRPSAPGGQEWRKWEK
jgi:suppressor of G2 allele of SKP1